MTGYSGVFAALPMLVLVILAEAFAWRSFFFWVLLGGGLGYLGRTVSRLASASDLADTRLTLYLGAGFVGGFLYWLIAGRLSGRSSLARLRQDQLDRKGAEHARE
jgi:hypothetical protein